jgi:hypothetical protein
MQKDLLHDLILDKEERRVKLNKCVIIKVEAMNRNEMFVSAGDMENMFEVEVMRGGGNDRSTNTSNGHTLAVGYVNLIMLVIVIMSRQFVQFPCDMICGTGI